MLVCCVCCVCPTLSIYDECPYLFYQMSVALWEDAVAADSRVVQSSKVMGNLVSKAVVAQSAGLLCYRGRVAGVVSEGPGHAAISKILDQQCSSVSRVPQLAGGALLHISECCQHIITLLNIGFLSTQFAGSQWDLTVDITLVSFSQDLLDKSLDVCRGVLKFLGVVEHDAVGHHSGGVILSVLHGLYDGIQAPLHMVILEGSHIVLLDKVAMMTLLDGVGLVIVSLETAEHVACLVVVRDHGLVPLAVVVDKPVWLHSGVEHEVGSQDVDLLAGEEQVGVNIDLRAVEEVGLITASLNTSALDWDYVDQTVTSPSHYFQTDIFFVDGCCKDCSDDQQEDKLHGSAGRITSEGDFIYCVLLFASVENITMS